VKTRWESALLCIPSNCDALVRARAMEIDAQRRTRLAVTLTAVRRELAALALDHGRKSLLLLSDGFLEDYGSDLRATAAASREANTAIYFLDVRGLVAKPGFGTASEVTSFTLPDPRDQFAMGFEDSVLLAAGAQTLADDTGGFSVRNSNDLAGGMERIAKESRVFYLLGFYPPPGKAAREWRKLSVEVKRPGLTVRARRGYTLRSEPEPAPRPKKGAPRPVADPTVARALDSALDAAGIPLRAMAYVLEPRPKDTTHVLVAAELDASRLAFQTKGTAQVARVEVGVVALGRDSGRGFRHDDTIDVSVPAVIGVASSAVVAGNRHEKYARSGELAPRAVHQEAMSQAAVADRQRVGRQLRQHGSHDARSGQDDLGPLGLKPDDQAALVGGS
jgi:hypothetical protein